MNYSQHISKKVTPQTEALAGQVANSAGGFSFPVDDWTRLDRFLVLGSEGGSYYATERTLTRENASCVERCIASDGARTVRQIVDISDAGRAVKNEPALLALAMAAKLGDVDTRRLAYEALPKVARIGTHLFHFAEYVKALGGWGRATTRAFSSWYNSRDARSLALQAVKYQARDGWSHRDILRKSHPKAVDAQHQDIYHWMVKGWPSVGETPHNDEALRLIWAFERAKALTEEKDVPALVKLVTDYRLPHECVPTEMKRYAKVWEALLPSMGLTALIRNLGKLTEVGVIAQGSSASKDVIASLSDVEALRKARIHPLNVLVALKTYSGGHGIKGKLSWNPVQRVVDALDSAFYLSFKAVEPTGKSFLLGVDCSGSMSIGIAGMPISSRDAAAAMALVTANIESDWSVMGFCGSFVDLKISPRMRLDDVVSAMNRHDWGATDCSLPMVYAQKNKMKVDCFCVYTDAETYHGGIHPTQALQQYRQAMGIRAKEVVVATVANGFTIADPNDAGQLDVIGFDTSTPSVIADFARS